MVQLHPGPPCPPKGGRNTEYNPEYKDQIPVFGILFSGQGAVAQLGERELCKLEVVGSIPIGSTILPRAKWFRLSGSLIFVLSASPTGPIDKLNMSELEEARSERTCWMEDDPSDPCSLTSVF